MKRLVVALVLVIFVCGAAGAQSVGLGPVIGLAFPQGSTPDIEADDWEAALNWGFFVNIPLLSTFHISPSAELYKLGGENATDMALAFKFIVPLANLDIHFGFVPGLTAVSDATAAHVGLVGGVSFLLISNLDLYVQGKYKVLFQGDENLKMLHANAGILFQF